MRLGNLNDMAEVFGEISQNKVGISVGNLDKIVGLLSVNLYSAPIPSFFREIVSNGWDSHVEAGNNNPVYVKVSRDVLDHNYISILIRDYGVGLSPERFDNVFRNMGDSTKDDSDDYIGAFGLGKFTSLAISDRVQLTSFHEGKKYDYLMYKNGTGINIDLMNTSETNEPNGFVVEVKLPYSQLINVQNAIKNQLSFFETVYYENEINPTHAASFKECKITHYESFSINSNVNCLSILLGKCVYPLNFDNMNLSYDERAFFRNMSDSKVAMRFGIGELDVNPTRETLHYTEKTISAIKEKIKEVESELHFLKFESLNNGVITDEMVINLPDSTILRLGEHHLRITPFNSAVKFHGVSYLYESLKNNVKTFLDLAMFQPEFELRKEKFSKMKSRITFREIFTKNIAEYDQSKYKNIEKKYIRQTYSQYYTRQNWSNLFDSRINKKILIKAIKNTPLVKVLLGLLISRLKSIKTFDISGLDDSFREENKSARSGTVGVKVEYLLNGNVRRKTIDEIIECAESKKLFIVTPNEKYKIEFEHIDSDKYQPIMVSETVKLRLSKKVEIITFKEWILTIKAKCLRDLKLQKVYNYFSRTDVEVLKLVYGESLHKDIIEAGSFNMGYSGYKYYFPVEDMEVDIKHLCIYDDVLRLSYAFNINNEDGKKFFLEKLKELKFVK